MFLQVCYLLKTDASSKDSKENFKKYLLSTLVTVCAIITSYSHSFLLENILGFLYKFLKMI